MRARRQGAGIARLVPLALLLGVLACTPSNESPGPPRNLLIVTLDSVRADRFDTPEAYCGLPLALAHFRDEAQSFRGISSAPATLPAVASLFTGRHPYELGHPAPDQLLPGDVATLAELFAAKGYDTAAFVGSRALATGSGIERGFATFDGPADARTEDYGVTQAAREWLSAEGRADRPWFVWVHLNAGHGPYSALETAFNPLNFFYKGMLPTPRSDERKLAKAKGNSGADGLPEYQRVAGPALFSRYREMYDARVRVGDWFANELRHALKYTEQYERTVFAVIGTHGEALGEHGVEFDHGHNLFDEVLRVPYLLRVPGRAPATSERLASQVDFAPTVARLFELELASSSGSDLFAEPARAVPIVFSELSRPTGAGSATAVRSRDWCVMRTEDGDPVAYDLRSDPEQRDALDTAALSADPKEPDPLRKQIAPLVRALEELERLPAPTPQRFPLDSDERSRLRSLGYVLGRFE